MKKVFLFVLLSAVVFTATSCSKKSSPVKAAEYDRIYVIADSTEFNFLHSALDSVFERIIYTPQPEKVFNLVRGDLDKLDELKDSKNIIIVAPLNSGSDVSRYINDLLDANLKTTISQNKQFAFDKYNLWSHDQLVMILAANDLNQLKSNILKNNNELFQKFMKVSNQRLYNNLYNEKYENREIESQLVKEYGWLIYVQKGYDLVINKPDEHFVLLRNMPNNELARWIFVHWKDNASPEFLNPDSIAKERNLLTQKYLKPAGSKSYVKITEEYKTTGDMNFHGRYALGTQGLWEMSDKSMGGPFINYTLFDEKTKRIYMLDGSIYAPKYMKKDLIQQLDVILQSFMTTDQLSEDRKGELLK